jgi:hypothetical protein
MVETIASVFDFDLCRLVFQRRADAKFIFVNLRVLCLARWLIRGYARAFIGGLFYKSSSTI